MTTQNVIDGLVILQQYRKNPNGYHLGAEHNTIYAYSTDYPLIGEDKKILDRLGWRCSEDGSWMCNV